MSDFLSILFGALKITSAIASLLSLMSVLNSSNRRFIMSIIFVCSLGVLAVTFVTEGQVLTDIEDIVLKSKRRSEPFPIDISGTYVGHIYDNVGAKQTTSLNVSTDFENDGLIINYMNPYTLEILNLKGKYDVRRGILKMDNKEIIEIDKDSFFTYLKINQPDQIWKFQKNNNISYYLP